MDGLAQRIQNQVGSIEGLNASVVDGEIRITYTPTGSNADKTAIKISSATGVAKDTIGIKEGDYNGFVAGTKDKTKIKEGISLLATASASATATVQLDVTDSKGTPLTSAINYTTVLRSTVTTADLKEINALVASVNSKLTTASVAARLDAVNGSLVFTSTDLGYRADVLDEFLWYCHDDKIHFILKNFDLEKIKQQKTFEDYKINLIIEVLQESVEKYKDFSLTIE